MTSPDPSTAAESTVVTAVAPGSSASGRGRRDGARRRDWGRGHAGCCCAADWRRSSTPGPAVPGSGVPRPELIADVPDGSFEAETAGSALLRAAISSPAGTASSESAEARRWRRDSPGASVVAKRASRSSTVVASMRWCAQRPGRSQGADASSRPPSRGSSLTRPPPQSCPCQPAILRVRAERRGWIGRRPAFPSGLACTCQLTHKWPIRAVPFVTNRRRVVRSVPVIRSPVKMVMRTGSKYSVRPAADVVDGPVDGSCGGSSQVVVHRVQPQGVVRRRTIPLLRPPHPGPPTAATRRAEPRPDHRRWR